jgi:hypothetical protein
MVFEDADTAKLMSSSLIRWPIGELAGLMIPQHAKNELLVLFPPEVAVSLSKNAGSDMCRFSIHIGHSQIGAITEAVRNKVLDWSLRLEEDGILGDGMTFTADEKDQAKKSTSVVIHNFQGIMGDVQHSTVSQNMIMQVGQGDLESLKNYGESIGLSSVDLAELEEAIQAQDSPIDSRNLGPKVGTWIGKMVAKAASGSWAISTATAADLLARAISSYYGLN